MSYILQTSRLSKTIGGKELVRDEGLHKNGYENDTEPLETDYGYG